MSGTLDVYLSNRSNRLTEITTVPTIVASIFIPLTFIAGLYGMNIIRITFVDSPWGYQFVLLLTIGVASAMLLYFKKRGIYDITPGAVHRTAGGGAGFPVEEMYGNGATAPGISGCEAAVSGRMRPGNPCHHFGPVTNTASSARSSLSATTV